MHNYYVASAEQITPTTLLLTLSKEEGAKPLSFQPGQYAAISFNHRGRPTTTRCFSIVSSPTDQDKLQFSMRTKGRFTKALQDLKKGDLVRVRGPYGGFVLDSGRDGHAVLLAGGIGIAPFISMIYFAAKTNLTNKIDLLYSCQTQDDVPFAKEITNNALENKNMRPKFIIAEGPSNKLAGASVETGRITPEILSKTLGDDFSNKTFFICGPPPFMKGMVGILRDKGVAKDRIITEAFSQGPNMQTGKIRSWPINMYILSGVGLVSASFAFMASDIIKTLPPTFIGNTAQPLKQPNLTNSRQEDLDAMVNELKSADSKLPVSAAAKKTLAAIAAAKKKEATSTSQSTTKAPTYSSSTPTVTKKTTTKKSTSSSSSSPAPAPAPAPKCTTSQSGVKTCQ